MTNLDQLIQIVGHDHVLSGDDIESFETDWRGRYRGTAKALVRPANTQEVAAVVKWCVANQVPIVPQGGNTGLCGAATPDDSGQAILLSLNRLNRIRAIDSDNDTIEVEAGCVLQAVQQAAFEVDRLFPLSLGAEGSCTIGGNLATNAGGTQVLRYGNARDLALGLEVVTADGDIWNGLRGLRKDNTGYALRDLYIGSEGTLGIITAATLKLYPLPVARCTALVALNSIDAAVALLSLARRYFGAMLTGFELMAGNCLDEVAHFFPQQRHPFTGDSAQLPWYALLELSDSESEAHARQRFEEVLGDAFEQELVLDAVIAENIAQGDALWHIRESIPLAEKERGKSIKHDISVPISKTKAFIETTNKALQERFPGIGHIIFGHLGDGNLHYNVTRGERFSEDELLAQQDAVYEIVHDSVHAFNGSISAEHGVGQLKRDILPRYKDATEIKLMHQIKQALDPHNIMNPGKVLAINKS